MLIVGIGLFSYSLSSPSFADEMLPVAYFQSCLEVMLDIACRYACDSNFEKTAVVFTGENIQETEHTVH